MNTVPVNSVPDFGLNSRQCYLLLVFENARTLTELASVIGRDPSVISRELKQIASQAPVLEKRGGSWHLTDVGKQLNRWTRGAVSSQREILGQGLTVTVAATPALVTSVLSPNLAGLVGADGIAQLSIVTAPGGTEALLLDGKCDIGFDVGRPQDPAVRFKKVAEATQVVVASKDFVKEHAIVVARDLVRQPHLFPRRADYPLPAEKLKILAYFDDPVAVKEAVRAGVGWSILPRYVVKNEIDQGTILIVPGWELPNEHLGVWWLSESSRADTWLERAVQWLTGLAASLK